MLFRVECQMVVRVVKILEADSYESAKDKAKMLDVPGLWAQPEQCWEVDDTSTPTIDNNELCVTAVP